mmetsp:Transcript_31485/g.28667  ORF Transcript_31485/g.28667 Transcript_31485/m.28667 type:complete len:141 (+) Transcript_31485:64-486(+)
MHSTIASLSPWIQRLFLISAFIASLSCFSRADYNLPLYIFAYMAWGLQRNQKTRIAWLLVITLITDFIWILYWGPFWGSDKFEDGYWENGVHTLVVVLSTINIFIKVVVLILIYRQENEVKSSFTVEGVKESISTFLSPN